MQVLVYSCDACERRVLGGVHPDHARSCDLVLEILPGTRRQRPELIDLCPHVSERLDEGATRTAADVEHDVAAVDLRRDLRVGESRRQLHDAADLNGRLFETFLNASHALSTLDMLCQRSTARLETMVKTTFSMALLFPHVDRVPAPVRRRA